MEDDDLKKTVLVCFIGLILFVGLIGALGYLGLLWDRPASKYAEETRRQTYDESRSYQQGTQLDLSRYCAQYQAATGPAKQAVAGLIRDTAATYSGPLTPNNQACLAEVGER